MKIRSKMVFLLTLLVIILLFGGCATRIDVKRLVPATHSMANYRNIALLPVKPYRLPIFETPGALVEDLSGSAPFRVYSGYQSFIEKSLANYSGELLKRELEKSSYFSLVETNFSNMADIVGEKYGTTELEAILDVQVRRLDVEEYVYARKVVNEDATETLVYYLRQKIGLEISYSVLDVQTGKAIYKDSFQNREEYTYALDSKKGPVIYAPDLTPKLRQMSEDLITSIVNSIAPRWVSSSISLMANRPKLPHLEDSYKAVKEGRLNFAYSQFLQEWEFSGHVASGYNGALILEALQRREEAIKLMQKVWQSSGSQKAKKQLDRMYRYREDQGEAESQF